MGASEPEPHQAHPVVIDAHHALYNKYFAAFPALDKSYGMKPAPQQTRRQRHVREEEPTEYLEPYASDLLVGDEDELIAELDSIMREDERHIAEQRDLKALGEALFGRRDSAAEVLAVMDTQEVEHMANHLALQRPASRMAETQPLSPTEIESDSSTVADPNVGWPAARSTDDLMTIGLQASMPATTSDGKAAMLDSLAVPDKEIDAILNANMDVSVWPPSSISRKRSRIDLTDADDDVPAARRPSPPCLPTSAQTSVMAAAETELFE